MVDQFKQSKFFLCVAQKMDYQEGIQFTENNIVQYLAELEEYISSLITYNAYLKNEPNAAISSIPLDKLETKEFQKKNITVDVPIGVNFESMPDASQSMPDGLGSGEDNLYNIVNAKELFAKFTQMNRAGHLQIVKAGNKNVNTVFAKEDDEMSNN